MWDFYWSNRAGCCTDKKVKNSIRNQCDPNGIVLTVRGQRHRADQLTSNALGVLCVCLCATTAHIFSTYGHCGVVAMSTTTHSIRYMSQIFIIEKALQAIRINCHQCHAAVANWPRNHNNRSFVCERGHNVPCINELRKNWKKKKYPTIVRMWSACHWPVSAVTLVQSADNLFCAEKEIKWNWPQVDITKIASFSLCIMCNSLNGWIHPSFLHSSATECRRDFSTHTHTHKVNSIS